MKTNKILLITYSRALNAPQYIDFFAQHGIEVINLNHKDFCTMYDNGEIPANLNDYCDAVIMLLPYRSDKRTFEILANANIRIFNPLECIKICDNKYRTYEILSEENVLQPKTYPTYESAEQAGMFDLEDDTGKMKHPVVIKTIDGSFGKGIYLVSYKQDLEQIITNLNNPTYNTSEYIFQEFIENSSGKDITAYVIGGEFKGCYMRENNQEFRSHVCHGGVAKEFTMTPAQQQSAVRIANIIKADLCSINFLLGENGELYVCEINARPSCQVYKKFSGIDIMDLYMQYLLNKVVGEHNENNNN